MSLVGLEADTVESSSKMIYVHVVGYIAPISNDLS